MLYWLSLYLYVGLNRNNLFQFFFCRLPAWKMNIVNRRKIYKKIKKLKKMKADKSFQIKAKHLHLFLQIKFSLTWLTLLFSLVGLVKYISSCLITWMGSLVSWSMLISTSFSCFLDASWFNLVHLFWDGLGVNGKT